MKFSYSWIEEMVDGLKMDAVELGRQITIKTAECEGVHAVGEAFAKAVLAKVASVEPIEGSKAKKTVVKSAAYGERVVVCGAPNVRAGMTSVYVPAGTVVNGKKIEKAIVHGVESDGMLCSGLELGINHDHEGILDLDGGIGCQPDWIIEIDNKSLTHRPDLWGHFGMAREVAAIYGLPLRDPVRPTLIPAEGHPV
nr:phenylalanine--tRNA ligase subunit beta [Bryobacter sp.]